jgi:hypothetical protein
MEDGAEITVLQLPRFKAEATDLIGTGGISSHKSLLNSDFLESENTPTGRVSRVSPGLIGSRFGGH